MQVFDGYFVKYFASVVALLVYAAPIFFKDPGQRGSRDDITQDYIRSMRLLQNTSKGVGDLVLVYKRITGLAGHTSRVAELLEQVGLLPSPPALPPPICGGHMVCHAFTWQKVPHMGTAQHHAVPM